ncbi:glycosyltransferase family 2 protein [Luteolibacter sp. LG18]|uniref:glycosyltransferase family 2 protein n=1 Tax=Luteolibacter sp. LG18 TaxID=2819286 RepID=UPI002B2B2743|nr:hypothetical protein llg_16260 [Luteolibacter sp. LG18]
MTQLGNPGEFLVTVAIPTYNRREWLERAIDSVLSQGHPEVLVHVFDNASADGTEEFMRGLVSSNPRVRYTRRPENIGWLLNYSGAMRAVDTPWLIGMGDDDWQLPEGIAALLKPLADNPDVGMVIGRTQRLAEGVKVEVYPDDTWKSGRNELHEAIPSWAEHGIVEWQSILISRKAFEEVGGLDHTVGIATDINLELKLLLKYPVFVVPQAVSVYNYHPGQESAKLNVDTIDQFLSIVHLFRRAARESGNPSLKRASKTFNRRWTKVFVNRLPKVARLPGLLRAVKALAIDFRCPGAAAKCAARWVLYKPWCAWKRLSSPRPAPVQS